MARLNGKTALITGAARGIGAATAALFAAEGANVIISDINDSDGQQLAEQLLNGASGKIEYRHLDVREESEWQALQQQLQSANVELNILVNNAGITGLLETGGQHDPENMDLASWHAVHRSNLDGVALGCKYAIAMMKTATAASIVNISSRSGMVGIPTAVAYASSKAAVRNHSKSVALYCAGQGYKIRCNSVHPGAILTPMWDAMLGDNDEEREANIAAVAADIPLGHMGCAKDVAHAVLYLASDESSYVTGIELTVDGGILAGSAAAPAAKD